ncbi:cation:proton antiporter regulatory subunit [Chloroflexota bacterium]
MQIFGGLIFLAVWFLILWIGAIALEASGMERSKARFQALSALSGTGFTTSQAESIVEDPRRRRIVSYLILMGNTGIIALLLLVILYARSGIAPPSTNVIIITIGIVVIIGLAIWLGLIDKITNTILKSTAKKDSSDGIKQKLLYQAGDYAVVSITINSSSSKIGLRLRDNVSQQDTTVLAIERDGSVIPNPLPEEKLLANDQLLCYGKLATINSKF